MTTIVERQLPHPDVPSWSDLRGVEDILVTLATWEDADDSFALPSPLAGQRALHAVRRVVDGFAHGRAQPDPADLRLVREALAALAKGLAAGGENLCYAVDLHDHARTWIHEGFRFRNASCTRQFLGEC